MSVVKPFQGLHYDFTKADDPSKVVSPPYDVISAEDQKYLHALSPHNFTHIDLAKDKPGDTGKSNKYTRAKKVFEEWQKKGVMIKDEKPCLYFYRQDYKYQGQRYGRVGFIGALKIENDKESKVYPHENTHAKAIEDRLKLTSTLQADLSPIFVCYSDRKKTVEKIMTKNLMSEKPLLDVEDKDGVWHRLWKVDDEESIQDVQNALLGQQLFIADGHHRYQMSKEYQKMRRSAKKRNTGDEPYNYVMTYFTNLDSKDLQIFPIHRIIVSLPKPLDFLEQYFRIDRIKTKQELVIQLARAGRNEHAFGLYTNKGFNLLRLKNKLLIEEKVKEGSLDFKRLDATILKYFVFDEVGIESSDIIYTKNIEEIIQAVDEGRAEAGFMLNPVSIDQLKAVALNGEKMPPKTTYFYPKVLSGLTVFKKD
jgi:uncharacterized protein (DUF1015 family)